MQYGKRDAKDYARANMKGIWAAALTPFNPDLSIDEAGFRHHVEYWVPFDIANGVSPLRLTLERLKSESDDRQTRIEMMDGPFHKRKTEQQRVKVLDATEIAGYEDLIADAADDHLVHFKPSRFASRPSVSSRRKDCSATNGQEDARLGTQRPTNWTNAFRTPDY